MPILRKAEEKLGLLTVGIQLSEDSLFYIQLEAIPVWSLDPPARAKGQRGKAGQGSLQENGHSTGRQSTL